MSEMRGTSEKYARCQCFFNSNIYLKQFNMHVTYKTEQQFINCYQKVFRELGCTDLLPVIHDVKLELERRRRIPYDSFDRTNFIHLHYKPVHQDIFELQEGFLHPELIDFVKQGMTQQSANFFRIHGEDIFSFPLFSSECCAKFLSELDNFTKSSMPKGKPNSMNNYGVLLDELGFNERFLNPLRKKYLEPISHLLFPEMSSHSLDSHKAFTVSYEENKDVELDFHFDNSEITVNICLLAKCDGGELLFRRANDESGFGYIHQEGFAVVHRGSAVHCVLPLIQGRRVNMVMWMRSSSVRNLRCPMCNNKPELEPVETGWGDGFTTQ